MLVGYSLGGLLLSAIGQVLFHLDVESDIGMLVGVKILQPLQGGLKVHRLIGWQGAQGLDVLDDLALDARQVAVLVDLDDAHRVFALLVKADGYRGAAITGALTHILRPVDVSQGSIVVTCTQGGDVDALHLHVAVMAREVAVAHCQVGHQHHGKLVGVFVVGLLEQGLEIGLLALFTFDVVHSCRYGKTAGVGKRNGGHDTLVAHLDDVAADVGLAVLVAGDGAHHGDTGQFPQPLVAVETRCAVVVAGDDDDGHRGACLVDVEHSLDIEADGCIRRSGSMEDVAAHEQGGGCLFAHDVGQLGQEIALFLATVIAIEILAQMPVTGV